MRLLVTGGSGFIGSNFIRLWLATHPRDDVLNLDLLTYARDEASLDDVRAAHGDRYRLTRADNYGHAQPPEKVLPLFITSALDDRPLPLYRHSENRREWIHVEDHCRAIALILERGREGETYNVGTGDERSIEQLADGVLDATGQAPSLK